MLTSNEFQVKAFVNFKHEKNKYENSNLKKFRLSPSPNRIDVLGEPIQQQSYYIKLYNQLLMNQILYRFINQPYDNFNEYNINCSSIKITNKSNLDFDEFIDVAINEFIRDYHIPNSVLHIFNTYYSSSPEYIHFRFDNTLIDIPAIEIR